MTAELLTCKWCGHTGEDVHIFNEPDSPECDIIADCSKRITENVMREARER